MFRPRDSLHMRAMAWSRVVHEPLLVTEYVLFETMNDLSAPIERPIAHQMLSLMISGDGCEVVWASPTVFNGAVQLHRQRADREWSLTDCASFQLMYERGITRALAFDHHFEQAGFEALLRRDPP
jgi:predicted nucleic acid-binding protein